MNPSHEDKATAAALAAGLASVAVGGLLYSAGFGALMTLIVVVPLAWVLGAMAIEAPAPEGPVHRYEPARGPLNLPPPPKPLPMSPVEKVLRFVGTLLFIMVIGGAALVLALLAVCASILSSAH